MSDSNGTSDETLEVEEAEASSGYSTSAQIEAPHHAAEGFIVSFTSLSIIMLTFFIYLNAIATPDLERERDVIGSLAKQFIRGPVPRSMIIPEKTHRLDMPIPELALGFPKMSFSTLYSAVADAAEAGDLSVERKADRFLISIPGEVLFASGDDQIKAKFLPVLVRIAKQALKYNLQIEIQGHTDNRPISTWRFPSNWELSVARAVSVLRFFLDQGISAERLSASGRGEHQPIASNQTEKGRTKNRRVVLIIRTDS